METLPIKKVEMLSNETGRFGEPLAAGETYDMEAPSADYWIVRGKAKAVDGLTVPVEEAGSMTATQLKEALTARNVEFASNAKKADLQALYDALPPAA